MTHYNTNNMKLQYDTVEYNVTKLNEEINTYNQMVKLDDGLAIEESRAKIINLVNNLKSSIDKRHFASKEDIYCDYHNNKWTVFYLRGSRRLDF
jgi:hypothetical protein